MNRLIFFVAVVAMTIMTTSLQGQAISVAQGQSQKAGNSGKITLSLRNAPLEVALETLEKQAQLGVTYARRALPSVRVNVSLANASVDQAYSEVLRGTGLALIQNTAGQYVLSARDGATKAQGSISGTIVDSKTGRGVIGANVSLDNNARSVVSGENGSYRLAGVISGNHTITVRLVGYAKQARTVVVGEGATAVVDFKLEASASVLEQVVVTGTIVQTELKAIPNAITVITAKQIEERGITRIDQLFHGDIPGLFSLSPGSYATLDEVTMFSRGATTLSTQNSSGINNSIGALTNSIKTYIDGVEMADSRYLSQIDPSSIERIEILTGPQASTIYGSNAINGVMQIFTKRGTVSRPQLIVNLTSGFTENNSSSRLAPNHIVDAGITGTEGRTSYNVGGSWNYVGSWIPGKQTQRLSTYGGTRIDMGKLITDLSARQGITKTKRKGKDEQGITDLRALGIYSPSSTQGQPNEQTHGLKGRTFGLSISYRPYHWWSHEMVLGSDESATELIRAIPGFSSRTDTTLFIVPTTTSRNSERYSNTIQLPVSSFARANLTLGADHWRTASSSWNALPMSITGNITTPSVTRNRPDKNRGAFVQGQFSFIDALFFTYGIRADWNPDFGKDARVNPGRYGVSYTRDIGAVSTKLRGSYGRSIRPPKPGLALAENAVFSGFSSSVIDQFGNYDHYKANPDLGPEHQSGGEGGIELYLGSRGSLIVTRYNQTVDNLISNVSRIDSARSLFPVFPSTTNCDFNGIDFTFDAEGHCFRYQLQRLNIGSIRNQGWEMQGSLNLGPLSTRGTYSWTKSRVTGITPRYRHLVTGTDFQPGRPFDYLPEHTWALGFTYTQARTVLALSVNGIGIRYLGVNAGDPLSLATQNRLQLTRTRMETPSRYRPLGSGYATADLNSTHRFSSRIDAVLQVNNLTDYYQSDAGAIYASAGRQSRLGVRWRIN